MTNIINPGGSKRIANTHSEAKNIVKLYPNLAIEIIERLLDNHPKSVSTNPYITGIELIKILRGI